MKKIASVATNLVLACTVLLFSVLVIEALSKIFWPTDFIITFRQTLPGLKAEVTYTRTPVDVRSLSMRSVKKPPGTIRIICCGASTTDQPVQNIEDTWSAFLEKRLNSCFGDKARIETAAYGCSGHKMADTFAWATDRGMALTPDIAILLQGVKDFAFNGYPGYEPKAPSSLPTDASRRDNVKTFTKQLLRKSNLCRFLVNFFVRIKLHNNEALEWASKNIPLLRERRSQFPLTDTVFRVYDPLLEFKEFSQAFVEFFNRRKIPVVLLSHPTLWKPELSPPEEGLLWFPICTENGSVRLSGKKLVEEFDRYNESLRALAQQTGNTYVPLAELLPKTPDVFFDDVHYTDNGSRQVADILYPFIVKEIEALLFYKDSL